MSLLLRGNTWVSFIILFFTNNVNCFLYVLGLYISIRGFKTGYKRVGRGWRGAYIRGGLWLEYKKRLFETRYSSAAGFLLSFIISW